MYSETYSSELNKSASVGSWEPEMDYVSNLCTKWIKSKIKITIMVNGNTLHYYSFM